MGVKSRAEIIFQTPKGVCLIGARSVGVDNATKVPIPDAERRLPHWSVPGEPAVGRVELDSRRRKASASLELRSLPHAPTRCRIPDAERRLPHWSARPYQVEEDVELIPDAERRLPHWSTEQRAGFGDVRPYSRRRKASASLEHANRSRGVQPPTNSRRRKASASLEPYWRRRRRARTMNSRRRKASASLERRVARPPAPPRARDSRRRKASASLEPAIRRRRRDGE